MSSAILYQNAACDVTLIDIPTSIAAAQRRTDLLLSTTPLERPIQSQGSHPTRWCKDGESGVDQANQADPPEQNVDAEYSTLIHEALAQISFHVAGDWCKPRKLLVHYFGNGGGGEKEVRHGEAEMECRLREWATWNEGRVAGNGNALALQSMMASWGGGAEDSEWRVSYCSDEVVGGGKTGEEAWKEAFPCAFHNPHDMAQRMTVSRCRSQGGLSGQAYRFTIPARSTFFLGDCMRSQVFRTSVRNMMSEHGLSRHFDLVLLDPPWPNRSVKRKGGYDQMGGMPLMKERLLKMDLDSYLQRNALVAIWITNKASMREYVLGSHGLFHHWNVGLREEWIWIKTTCKGEPMLDMTDSSRKPYEILLLGRAGPTAWTTMAHASPVKRRVIAAVPDVHSRKPCLKELLEGSMALPEHYHALEVFSRHLVAGWASWGNETIKYNWDEYWTR